VENFSEKDYKKCLGDPAEMKKMIKRKEPNYQRKARFTQIIGEMQGASIKVCDLNDLFKKWGIASEFLHFLGVNELTIFNDDWYISAIARIEKELDQLWEAATNTEGIGIMSLEKMPQEVLTAWELYSEDKLSDEDLVTRLKLMQPVLQMRSGLNPLG